METQELFFQLSEPDEQIVRNYECTRLRKLLSPATIGYLTVTNKRVVFHSQAKSLTGKSLLINEMPLEDAAGVSSYLGMSISWFQFALFASVLYFGTQILSALLPAFFTGWVFATLLMLPYVLMWLLSGDLLNEQVKDRIIQSANEAFQSRLDVQREIERFQPQARVLFYVGLAILAWATLDQSSLPGLLRLPLLAAIYFLLYLFVFGRHRVFSLSIGSRTIKGTGIDIPGDSFRALFLRQNTAAESLSASPAVDAEQVARELGALLMDINQLGDLGIEKWKSTQDQ